MFLNKEDTRIYHTKNFIYEALIELLKEYDYSKITISMIIKKSGVGRTTFYRHFYSKEDILLFKLKSESLEMFQLINTTCDLTIYDKDIHDKIKLFFSYWHLHPEIIQIIIQLDQTQMLYSYWPTLLIEIFSLTHIAISEQSSYLYTAHFAIGGLTSLLIQWFKNERKESVDFISRHFYIPN